jgi:hypothetical protein
MGHCYQGLPAKVKLENKLNYILTPYFDCYSENGIFIPGGERSS